MPRVRRGTVRVLVLALTCSGLTGTATVLDPRPASAAGTVVFDQPFHNNTANGNGAVVLPAPPPVRA
ncbi:hypothetical protein ACFQX6_35060 [Streptosporangium lutulentum]